LYHSFNIVEYPLLCAFLLYAVKQPKIKLAIQISILFYIITCFSISQFYYHFKNFPGLNINIEAIFLSLICTYILFNLEIDEERSILKNENFWISAGLLIFFGTTFFYNGIYTKLINIDTEKALDLFGLINRPLNIILYSSIIIGILCLQTNKKRTTT
jgi:hypothetical protein